MSQWDDNPTHMPRLSKKHASEWGSKLRVGKTQLFFLWPMHWVLRFNAENPISVNKTMVLFQLPSYVFRPVIIIKGEKQIQLFPAGALDFRF